MNRLPNPMLLHQGRKTPPFDKPGWVYELKFEGYRLVAGVEPGKVRLVTRGGQDATAPMGTPLASVQAWTNIPWACCWRRPEMRWLSLNSMVQIGLSAAIPLKGLSPHPEAIMSINATRNRRNPNRRPVPHLEEVDDRDLYQDYDDDDTYPDFRSRLHDEDIADLLRLVTPATA